MQVSTRILVICVAIILVILPTQAISQNSSNNQTATTAKDTTITDSLKLTTTNAESGKKGMAPGLTGQTILDLLSTAQEIGYLLILVFILGVLFVLQQWYVLRREKKDSKKIPIDKIRTLDIKDIQKMFTKIESEKSTTADSKTTEKVPLLRKIFRRKKAAAYQLMYKLYKVFESKRTTNGLGEEISSFKQNLKDLFNPFMTRLAFLSDTAGGLGLLGTVWGMFLVFYKGSPDQNEILSGMGIALSTTIIGLVISIILNLLSTVVSNMFDSHLDRIDKMGNVFFDRLLKEEVKQPPVPIQVVGQVGQPVQPVVVTPPVVIEKEKEVEKVDEKPKEVTPAPMAFGKPTSIKIISGDNQRGEVNNKLPKLIIVEVRDQNGNLLENETVIFTAEDGAGTFPNNSKVHKILTDEEGRAQTELLLGKKAGEKTIRVSVERGDNLSIAMLAIAKPTPPEKFIEVDGNYQTGEMDRRLPKPFIVAIRDKYDNPIQQYGVEFNLKKGTGKFQDSLNAHYSTVTNEDGVAEVYFIMGNNRGAREIEVEAAKVDPAKIKFEAFAL